MDPKNANALRARGGIYKEKGDYKKALSDYAEALKIDPKNTFWIWKRGQVYYAQGDYTTALDDFNTAMNLDSPNPYRAGIQVDIDKVKAKLTGGNPFD